MSWSWVNKWNLSCTSLFKNDIFDIGIQMAENFAILASWRSKTVVLAQKTSNRVFISEETIFLVRVNRRVFKRRPTSEELNTEIHSVSHWLHQNNLDLNEPKTFALNFFETKANTNIQNCAVQKCNTYKYLGVILDSNLTFEPHAESICLKLKKWIGIIARLRETYSHNTILMLYKTTVVPIFEYGLLFYDGTSFMIFMINKLQKIERLHNKILRIVCRKKPSDSIFETFFEFKILTMCELYMKHLLSFSFKSYFGLHSNKMMNEILTANQNFSFNTHSKTTRILQTKTSKRNSTRTSLGYRGRILINFLLK